MMRGVDDDVAGGVSKDVSVVMGSMRGEGCGVCVESDSRGSERELRDLGRWSSFLVLAGKSRRKSTGGGGRRWGGRRK
ncbi:hypothetical protein Tco_0178079 [Tanacetum coccineum]